MLGLLAISVASAGEMGGLLTEDIQVDGGILNIEKDRNLMVLRQYATISIGGATVRARNMTYSITDRTIYAEGDVTFSEPGGSVLVCDRLFFNTVEWRGIAETVRVKAEQQAVAVPEVTFVGEAPLGPSARPSTGAVGEIRRMVVIADEVRGIDKYHQEMIHAKVTPSLFAVPHWHLASAAVNVRRGEKIESWHNVLKIGRVPVFYFPYIIKDLKYDWPWLRIGGGFSSEHGAYVFTKTGLDFDENPEAFLEIENLFFDIDYRQKRGWAFGAESEYRLGKGGKGFLDLYYTNEGGIDGDDDLERAENDNEDIVYKSDRRWEPTLYGDTDRYTIDWEHRQIFNDRLDLRAEAHVYSDRDFRDEYFEWDDKLDKEPETSVDLRYRADRWQAELVASRRLNDFQSQTEYLPELRFYLPGAQIGDWPLYLQSESRIGYLTRRFDTLLDRYDQLENEEFRVTGGDRTPYVARAFNETRLELPIDLGPAVFKPWAGGRVAYYSEIYGEPATDAQLTAAQRDLRDRGIYDESHILDDAGESATSAAAIWGADLSTRLYGIFGEQRNWRHTIHPTLRFVGQEKPGVDPDWLYAFDDVDAYDEAHYFEFDLNNKLEYRRDNGTVREVVNFNLGLRYYPDEQEAERAVERDNLDPERTRHLTEIDADLILRPADHLVMTAGARFDPYDGKFNHYHASADWTYEDRLRLYLYHQHYRGNYWRYPGAAEYDRTTLAARFPLWDPAKSRYAAEIAFTYDWSDNIETFDGFVEKRFTLYRDLDTFELGMSLIQDKKDVDTDYAVFFSLRPKGWSGIDRPSPVSDAASRMPSRYGDRYTTTEPALPEALQIIPEEPGHDTQQLPLGPAVGRGGEEPISTPEELKANPDLVPGRDDRVFQGNLPTLEDAGDDPDPFAAP